MLELQRREKSRVHKQAILFSCMVVVICLGFTPAYGGGIADLLNTIIGFIVGAIAKMILFVLEFAAGFFLKAMQMDISTLSSMGILDGFELFAGGIQLLAVLLASVLVLWQLFTVFFGPMLGVQQKQSIGTIVGKALVFIPLTYLVQDLALILLGEIQKIYNAFLSVFDSRVVMNLLSSQINLGTVADDFGLVGGDLLDVALVATMGVVIAVIIMVLVMWNFIKLLFESAQRFVAMVIYAYLSPLAMATAVTGSNIASTSLLLFVSSGVLWVLNVWSIGIALMIMNSLGNAVAAGIQGIFVWCVFAYGFIKIAQQLDDLFNAVGATNVRFSGSLLGDMMELGRVTEMGGKIKRGVTNFAENGFFGGGSSAANPQQPQTRGIPNMKSGTAAAAGMAGAAATKAATAANVKKNTAGTGGASSRTVPSPNLQKTATGHTPRGVGQQLAQGAATIAGKTPGGMLARGIVKTGSNISSRVNAGISEAKMASNNAAMTGVQNALSKGTPEARAAAMRSLSATGALNNSAAKNYVGEAMGLSANQKVTGLSVNKDGQMSAMVATTRENGSVKMSSVSGINDMNFNKGNFAPGTAGDGAKMATYSNGVLTGNTGDAVPARLSYSSKDGKAGEIAVTKFGTDYSTDDAGNKVVTDKFNVTNSAGEVLTSVSAPSGIGATGVAAMIAGKAEYDGVEGAGRVQSRINIDKDAGTTISNGNAWESRDDATASLEYSTGQSAGTVTKISSDDTSSQWQYTNGAGETRTIEAAPDATIRDVSQPLADEINGKMTLSAPEIEPHPHATSADGIHENGTNWNEEFTYTSNASSSSSTHDAGKIDTADGQVWFEPTGEAKDGKVEYTFGSQDGIYGEHSLNADVTAEDIATAILSKDPQAGMEFIKEFQKDQDINGFTGNQRDDIADLLRKAKNNSNRPSSETVVDENSFDDYED